MQITTPCESTCSPWATPADVCSPCNEYGFDQALLDNALQVASDILFEFSGRRFAGVCQDTVRPCARWKDGDRGRPVRPLYPTATYLDGWNASWGFCSCNREERSGCGSLPEITLGGYPLSGIVEVKIDGQVVDPSTYRIDDDRWLVRVTPDAATPNQGWPCCQRMDLPDTQKETWSVTYTYGQPPPPAGVMAAASLGCQLAMACDPATSSQCRLPERVTQVTRQGMTMVLLDPMAFLENGKTGIYEVDLFLASVNPKGLTRRATVMSPDRGRRVRRTGV